MKLQYHRQAASEVKQAISYYTERDPDVCGRFLAELQRVTSRLLTFPEAGPAVDDTVRRIPLLGFPFQLLYRVRPDSIHVLAVAHTSRRPGYWRGRL